MAKKHMKRVFNVAVTLQEPTDLSGEAGEVLLVGPLHLPFHFFLPHTLLLQKPVHLHGNRKHIEQCSP
jgi:hypothetical protein